MPMGALTCRVCRNEEGNTTFHAREMMFGTREEFLYFECASCGCVQIAEIPECIDRYYPSGYYSFTKGDYVAPGRLSIFLKKQLVSHYSGQRNILGMLLSLRYRNELPWLTEELANRELRMLDVGCGNGRTLNQLFSAGYRRLSGIDQYVEGDLEYPNGVRISRIGIEEVRPEFDVVMFHQSFEHMPDPAGTLREAHRILAPGGHLIIRSPTVSSFAWRKYRSNWVQLDPPRHFFLHSTMSMRLLATEAGFQLGKVVHDSTDFQFAGSEAYLLDIPLKEYYVGREIFSPAQKKHFSREAERLNRISDGDSACFYLQKPH